MSFSFRLVVSAPGHRPSEIAISQKQLQMLGPASVTLGDWMWQEAGSHWLAWGTVTTQSPVDPKTLRAGLDKLSETLRSDVNWVAEDKFNFMPKLLLLDVDSTLIQQETIDELGKKMGVGGKIAEITQRAMSGKVKFEDALQERLMYLVGLRPEDFLSVLPSLQLQEGAADLIQWAKNQEIVLACVSGGFDLIVEKLAKEYGIPYFHAHRLEFIGGRFSGKILSPIIDGQEKAKFLMKLCKQLNVTPQEVVAIGDGANDVAMIRKSRLSVGLRPKPKLAKEVDLVLNYSTMALLPAFFKKQ